MSQRESRFRKKDQMNRRYFSSVDIDSGLFLIHEFWYKCTSVILYSPVLLYYRTPVLLYCCTAVLLYSCTPVFTYLSLCSTPLRSLLCLDQTILGWGFPVAPQFRVTLEPGDDHNDDNDIYNDSNADNVTKRIKINKPT